MNIYKILIKTFFITAIWDVILRVMSENYYSLPIFLQYDFIRYLRPYFKKHTLLSAALIAGMVGAVTQYIILHLIKVPTKIGFTPEIMNFIVVSFLISGLIGFPMKWSGLFPHLNEYYYKPLGDIRGFYHDGISGVIVQFTLLLIK